jgi:hypothetical protein
MANIKISEENKARLDSLLAKRIGEKGTPNVTMDDVVTELLDAEVKE